MLDVEGFILVGGASSRMGSDKSQLSFGDQTGVERIAAALRSVATRVRLVGSRNRPNDAFQNIPDAHERWGALGGIEAALKSCRAEWAAIVACDLPLVTGELFTRLWQVARRTEGEVVDAIVPIQPDGRQQPLCALYRCESCSTKVAQLIEEGEHTPRMLLARVRTRWVEFRELADLPGAEHFFFNVNKPEDYQRAKELLNQLQKD